MASSYVDIHPHVIATDNVRYPLQPLGGNQMPRFGGPATFMRLPAQDTAEGLDVAFYGIPFDIGTSNRPGARFAPRAIRAESCLLRPYHMTTMAAPFDSLRVGDIGDVAINTFNAPANVGIIRDFVAGVLAAGAIPIGIGGDHTVTHPILQAIAAVHGPVGVVHVDAHADVNMAMFGEPISHGSWVRRAVEEGLLQPERLVQIGLRGTGYEASDFDWVRSIGGRVVVADECWHRSLAPLMAEAIHRINTEADVIWVDGHSDYGHAFEVFWDKWGNEINPKSTIMLLGDARNNYHASQAWVIKEMRQKARHVYWLNPEPKSYWNTGDSIVGEYGTHTDGVFECRNLRQLEAFVEKLV